ncbi:MAG: cytochrome c3 family protein [Hydrogenovibrio sp.]|uniref:c(7)-type cytochrome triheme domain-containing protein n=1 Tax=Hydrogenovibrio sp. TaxID=2065821 RepID=UPI00286FFFE1|nr:c(7)-type cytochrome triheme domain-containing protein [Hydrogenovibrio sp.]MDR9499663.1 cytochrome c3 family protein [Hydrogenovibrio sp.]
MLGLKNFFLALGLSLASSMVLVAPAPVQAEYGDIVLNNFAEEAEVRPVVFPHWFHRVRFNCSVCHADLGFKMQAGGNDITMSKIIEGEYCGACHNNEIAWAIENCDICHSGKKGIETQVMGSDLRAVKKNKANK